jgi:hypothetical protein
MNSCKTKKFPLILFLKIFLKLWMFLLFPCLGTILAPSCPASCQPSFSPSPSSGSIVAASSYLSSRFTTAPTLFCATDLAPSLSEFGPGTRSLPQPPQGLHGYVLQAWQPESPRQTAGFALRWSCRDQAGLVFKPAGLFTFFSDAAIKRSRNRFPTRWEGFWTSRTGGAFTVFTEAVPVLSMGIATKVRPLTSPPSTQAQGEPCGDLPTPLVVKLVGCTLTALYSLCI